MLNDTTNQYIYDGEGRICAVRSLISGAIYGYVYDGNGDRIAKGTLSSFSCNLSSNGFAIQNAYVVGQAGEQLSEMGSTQNWLHMNVFAGGKLVATYGGGTTYFALSDWLGTKRVETVPNGTCLSTYASLAYGDELTPSGTCPDATEHHYTTKEHDAESGNDFFLARYYSSTAGRFVSPDWASGAEAVPYATFGDPQSLNLYGYVGNNPLSKADADGHSTIKFDGEAHTITIYSKTGAKIGTFSAYNNVAVHNRNGSLTGGPMPDGVHPVMKQDQHGATAHVGGSANSAYGKNGIINLKSYKGVTGKTVSGAGVHSGRANSGGPAHLTLGCIRTTDRATGTINAVAKKDPVTSVTVQNNEANIQQWKKKAEMH